MLTVIKLVNVYYCDENHYPVKVTFKTTIEDTDDFDKHHYVIINDKKQREVTCDEGNAEYKYLRMKYPTSKAIILVNTTYEAITHIRVAEHFEVYLGYDFVCSCDTMQEVRECEKKMREKMR